MRWHFIPVFLVLFSACGSDLSREDLLPNATGQHGEIILLVEDELWNGIIGDALLYQLNQNTKGPALRPEPMFDLRRMRPKELNHQSQLNRNILKVIIDKDSVYQQTAIIEKRNFYAKNQLFIIVKDNDVNRLYSFIVNEFAYVIDKFNNFELNVLIDKYTKNPNKKVLETTKKNFGVELFVPKESKLKVDSSNFMWIKHDRSRNVMSNSKNSGAEVYWIQQGILVWSHPYTDTTQLTVDGVLSTRDSVLKHNVAGKVKGSYMATEYDKYLAPESKIFKNKDAYTIEVRGIWKHDGRDGAFGGGPFIQYTFLHEKRQKVTTICIYIYGPGYQKREYIREGEAMLKAFNFVD